MRVQERVGHGAVCTPAAAIYTSLFPPKNQPLEPSTCADGRNLKLFLPRDQVSIAIVLPLWARAQARVCLAPLGLPGSARQAGSCAEYY